MINIITAIGNPYLNEKIKKIKNYNIILKDILYKEGIIEILNINKNINILLISIEILEENNFIENIRKNSENLEIVIFTNKNRESDISYFNSKNIYKIYSNNRIGYEEYLKTIEINEKKFTEKLKIDMENFKQEILEKQYKKNKKIKYYEKNIPKKIIVSGARGVRKKYIFKCFFSLHRK